MEQLQTLFGSRSMASSLLFIEAYGSGYASEIASTFDVPLNAVQRQLIKLETNGILVSRTIGRTRVFEFNPRGRMVRDLREFLTAQIESMPKDVYQQYFCQRRRPRRTGKKL